MGVEHRHCGDDVYGRALWDEDPVYCQVFQSLAVMGCGWSVQTENFFDKAVEILHAVNVGKAQVWLLNGHLGNLSTNARLYVVVGRHQINRPRQSVSTCSVPCREKLEALPNDQLGFPCKWALLNLEDLHGQESFLP